MPIGECNSVNKTFLFQYSSEQIIEILRKMNYCHNKKETNEHEYKSLVLSTTPSSTGKNNNLMIEV